MKMDKHVHTNIDLPNQLPINYTNMISNKTEDKEEYYSYIPESITNRIKKFANQNTSKISEIDFYISAFIVLMYRYMQTDIIRIPVIKSLKTEVEFENNILKISSPMSVEDIIEELCDVNKKHILQYIPKKNNYNWNKLLNCADTILIF